MATNYRLRMVAAHRARRKKVGPIYSLMLELERAAFYHRHTRFAFDALLKAVADTARERDRARREVRSLSHRRLPVPDYAEMAEMAVATIAGPRETWRADGPEHHAVTAILQAWADERKARAAA